jgi:hypothetical protein
MKKLIMRATKALIMAAIHPSVKSSFIISTSHFHAEQTKVTIPSQIFHQKPPTIEEDLATLLSRIIVPLLNANVS